MMVFLRKFREQRISCGLIRGSSDDLFDCFYTNDTNVHFAKIKDSVTDF